MSDRLKFRIFNYDKQEYHLEKGTFLHPKGQLIEYAGYLPTNFIVEQCTGLKDKNGKLIYEGDVLRFNGIFIDCCVIFRNGAFEYSLCEDDKISYRLNEVIAKSTQIIGNIHEMEQ